LLQLSTICDVSHGDSSPGSGGGGEADIIPPAVVPEEQQPSFLRQPSFFQ